MQKMGSCTSNMLRNVIYRLFTSQCLPYVVLRFQELPRRIAIALTYTTIDHVVEYIACIPKFGDASKASAGDIASPNCGICDTAVSSRNNGHGDRTTKSFQLYHFLDFGNWIKITTYTKWY
jgi:hypothetical protein